MIFHLFNSKNVERQILEIVIRKLHTRQRLLLRVAVWTPTHVVADLAVENNHAILGGKNAPGVILLPGLPNCVSFLLPRSFSLHLANVTPFAFLKRQPETISVLSYSLTFPPFFRLFLFYQPLPFLGVNPCVVAWYLWFVFFLLLWGQNTRHSNRNPGRVAEPHN